MKFANAFLKVARLSAVADMFCNGGYGNRCLPEQKRSYARITLSIPVIPKNDAYAQNKNTNAGDPERVEGGSLKPKTCGERRRTILGPERSRSAHGVNERKIHSTGCSSVWEELPVPKNADGPCHRRSAFKERLLHDDRSALRGREVIVVSPRSQAGELEDKDLALPKTPVGIEFRIIGVRRMRIGCHP